MKGYRGDYVALVIAIAVMALAFFILPDHLSGLFRGGVGLLIALILFGAYVFGLRKPDSLLELEELLRQSALKASQISEIAKKQNSNVRLAKQIAEVAVRIAHVDTKCLTRDLFSIEVYVRRLARVAHDVIVFLAVLNGEVRLRNSAQEIVEIQTKKIPDALQTLEDIEVAIDAVEAKAYEAAEDDLDTLTQLSNLSAKSGEAVAMLKEIIRDNPKRG